MKKRLLLIFLPCFLLAKEPLRDVEIGVHVIDIYAIDWAKQTVDLSLWVWYLYDPPDLDLLDNITVNNAVKLDKIQEFSSLKKGKVWSVAKIRCSVLQDWALKNFPFSSDQIKMQFEPTFINLPITFIPDVKGSNIDEEIDITSWELEKPKWVVHNEALHSSMGEPNDRQEKMLPAADLILPLKRHGLSLFLRLFSIMYISYFLSLAIFFVPPMEINTKTALVIGSVFSWLANHFMLQKLLPPVGGLMFSDILQITISLFIAFSVIVMLATRYFVRIEKVTFARVLDLVLGVISLVLFVSVNVILIRGAMHV